ncbi:CBS domain-containing protein [Streptomyces sp. MS1.AVA.4]|uniref:CBS domain-containing protein n=1 Tax=Streptomyces pratisoli TaxID=3139917 RepID=A0ACC6QBD0_9ACTN
MKDSKVGSLMTSEVISAVPTTSFKELAKRLAEHDITGLPVLDEDDRVVGVISESDLLVHQAAAADARYGRLMPGHSADTGPDADKRVAITAGALMSAPAVTVHADDTVAEAARTMLRRSVERMPVVDDEDRLVGIVTRRDLLQVFLRPDTEIRLRVIGEVLVHTLGLAPDEVDVHVVDGTVTLEGQLETLGQISVLVKLVGQMDGVVSVTERLTARTDDSSLPRSLRTTHGLSS